MEFCATTWRTKLGHHPTVPYSSPHAGHQLCDAHLVQQLERHGPLIRRTAGADGRAETSRRSSALSEVSHEEVNHEKPIGGLSMFIHPSIGFLLVSTIQGGV